MTCIVITGLTAILTIKLYLVLGISYLVGTKKGGIVAPAVTFPGTGCNTRKVIV